MFLSLFELGLALLIGLLCLYVTHYVTVRIYASKYPADKYHQNNAFLIFLAGTMFSVSYLMTGIIEPLSSTLELLVRTHEQLTTVILQYSKFLGLFLVVGLILGAGINFVAYFLFSSLTSDLDEFEELSKGNMGVAIVVSVIVVVISLFCKESFLVFLESFIPYPELPRVF